MGRSGRWVVAAAVAVLVLDGLALVFRTGATPVSVGAAVARYRAQVAASHYQPPPAPTTTVAANRHLPTSTTRPSVTSTTAAPSRGRPTSTPTAGVAEAHQQVGGRGRGGRGGAASPEAGSAVPTPGVYVYSTTGHEALSTPGSSRSYPAQTTITVTADGTGCQSDRWDPLEQHWEQYRICYGPGPTSNLVSSSSYVSFYGIGDTTSMTCAQPAYWRPPSDAAGTRWSYTCTSAGTTYSTVGAVVGTGSVVVGGQPVPAVHLQVDTTFSGSEQGDNPEDLWLAVSNSLVLRLSGTVQASESTGPFGHVGYQEDFDLQLTSLTPQQ